MTYNHATDELVIKPNIEPDRLAVRILVEEELYRPGGDMEC
jgi:hypothetical protein